jgi:beta-barrel assembly-enhancing protease
MERLKPQKRKVPEYSLAPLAPRFLAQWLGAMPGIFWRRGRNSDSGRIFLNTAESMKPRQTILGAQILARAGYDPMDLARMFQTIEKQGGGGGPEWLSSHPNPGNRYERISQEAQKLTIAKRSNQTSDFARIQSSLKRMAAAPTMEEAAHSAKGSTGPYPDDARVQSKVELPFDRIQDL